MIKRYSVAANRYVMICLINEPHFKFLWDDEISEKRQKARKLMSVIAGCQSCNLNGVRAFAKEKTSAQECF